MVVKSFIGMIVPFTMSGTLVGTKSAVIALIDSVIMLVELLLRSASASPKVGRFESSSSGLASVVAKSSARRTSAHVVVAKAGFKVTIEASSKVLIGSTSHWLVTFASVLWIQGTVLSEMRSLVGSTWLVALSVFSFLFGFLKLLQLGLCLFLVAVFFVSEFLLLFHEVFDLLLRSQLQVIPIQGEF